MKIKTENLVMALRFLYPFFQLASIVINLSKFYFKLYKIYEFYLADNIIHRLPQFSHFLMGKETMATLITSVVIMNLFYLKKKVREA